MRVISLNDSDQWLTISSRVIDVPFAQPKVITRIGSEDRLLHVSRLLPRETFRKKFPIRRAQHLARRIASDLAPSVPGNNPLARSIIHRFGDVRSDVIRRPNLRMTDGLKSRAAKITLSYIRGRTARKRSFPPCRTDGK